jgi:trimethylamine--corrinoid protein Co-methyltransferase
LALDAIVGNTPGKHYLDSPHTLKNYTTAFWVSSLASNSSFEQWRDEGSLDAVTRANTVWKARLAGYEPPPIDDAVDAELKAFIGRRRSEIAAERDLA